MKRNWKDTYNRTKENIQASLIFGIIMAIGLSLVVFGVTGCAKQDYKPRLECIDNNLYEVHPQKVELLLQDSCDKGRIQLRS